MECQNCNWSWGIEAGDKNPFLCHKCGYDSKLNKFDMESFKNWKKENNFPFEESVEKKYIVRTFSENVDNDELVWHRDKEDRIVKAIGKTDWMVQLDNELPRPLTEMVYIPKNTFHRVIKGTGDLKVRVNKLL